MSVKRSAGAPHPWPRGHLYPARVRGALMAWYDTTVYMLERSQVLRGTRHKHNRPTPHVAVMNAVVVTGAVMVMWWCDRCPLLTFLRHAP